MIAAPRLNPAYWLALSLASVFGANVGDFISDVLRIGHLRGLPILAALLAAIFLLDRTTARPNIFGYWAAIITIRAAATNIGDGFRDVGIGFNVSVPLVAIGLIGLAFLYKTNSFSRPADGPPPVNLPYWLCMGCAGVLGTLAGDDLAYVAKLGNLWATVVFAAAVAGLLALRARRVLDGVLAFWLTVALIRAAGTTAGDFLASRVFGLVTCTAVMAVVFCAAIVALYGRDRGDRAPLASGAGRP